MKVPFRKILPATTKAVSLALLTLGLTWVTPAKAQLLEHDGFNYAGTALHLQNGGTGWGNAWTNTDGSFLLSNDGLSLAYPPGVTFTPTGSRISMAGAGVTERLLGTTMSLAVESNTFFFSALVKYQGSFKFEFWDATVNPRWRIGATNDNQSALLGITGDGKTASIFPTNQTVMVIAKYLTRAGTVNDTVYLNLYRAGDAVPAAEPTSWQATAAANSGVVLTRLRIQNFMALPLEVDEIRIGTNWVSVAGVVAAGPPIITKQPASTNVYQGSPVQFAVEAAGALPLSYQWKKGVSDLLNATNATFLLTNVQAADVGNYSVSVSNSLGTTNSTTATLSLILITNISVGMQGYWHFDETTGLTAYDATANHNDGTLVSFPGDNSQWIPSDFNGALNFSGSNYVEIPHSASLANFANHFSVAAWIRSSVMLSASAQLYRMLEKENTFFLLQGDGSTSLGNGGVSVLVKKGGGNYGLGVGQALNSNQWYHVAGTYDGSTLSIYLDGQLKATRAVAAPIDTTTLPMRIGSDYNTVVASLRYFPGAMDEVGVWERALTTNEILQLAGQAGPPVILGQPQPQTKYEGGTATFQVSARGQQPLRYLWYFGTNELRTATTNVLVVANIQLDQAGEYRCLVANDQGGVLSDPGLLTVVPVTNITDAMEALWKFDESTGLTAADSSGHGRDGSLLDFPDATSQWGVGQVGEALSFDGQSNRVSATSTGAMNLGADASVAFWVRPTTYGTFENTGGFTRNMSRILRKGGYLDIESVDDPSSVRATIRANGVAAPQNALQTNQWQHFVVVFSGGKVTFYKNGFRLGDPLAGNLGATNANVVVLGTSSETMTATNMYHGLMDEVGVWSRVLKETEILSLAGRDIAGPPVIVAQPQSATRFVGGSMSFLVSVTGLRPVTYQWLHDNAPIADSNTNRLALTNLTLADAGNYVVRVQNSLGTVTSTPPAVLIVQQVTNVASGLVAYWTFDETNGTIFADASGRGHDATLQNATAVPGVAGMVGGSFNFDGVNDFAVVPHAAELNISDQASISFWINPRSFGSAAGGYARILRNDVNYDLAIVSDNSLLRTYGLNKVAYDSPAGSVAINVWQQFALVFKDGTMQIFKNGRSLASPIPVQLGPETLASLIIGNYGPDLSLNRVFDGYIDDLGIWNRALTSDEIDGIYQNGLGGMPLNAPFIPFRVQSLGFTNGNHVRLVYTSPHSGRTHVIQRNTQLNPTNWVDETPLSTTELGGGWTQAVLSPPGGNSSFYRVMVLGLAPLFVEDFETGGTNWTHGGAGDNWAVGRPVNGPGAAFGGTNVAATGLNANINAYSDCYLRSPVINLTSASRGTLTFEQWRNVDPDPTFHGCIVNVLDPANFAVLQQLSLESGSSGGWQLSTLPLPPSLLGRNIMLEFRLYCDVFNLLEGWYIDDVKIMPE